MDNSSKILSLILSIAVGICTFIFMDSYGADWILHNCFFSGHAYHYLVDKYESEFMFDDISSDVCTFYQSDVEVDKKERTNVFSVIKNDDGSYSDNYYGIYVHDDFYNLIDEKVSKYFDNYTICFDFNNDFYDTVWDVNTPLGWALEDNSDYFNVTIGIFTSDDVTDDKLSEFYESFSEDFWQGEIYVYTAAPGNVASFRDSNFRDFISKNRYTNYNKGHYVLGDDENGK